MKKLSMLLLLSLFTYSAQSNDSVYIGKIKSLYSHERDANAYFGIELEGAMDNNPCGNVLTLFIKKPEDVSDMHMSMLLAAHLSGRDVEIRNANASETQKCHGPYSTFNMVKVL